MWKRPKQSRCCRPGLRHPVPDSALGVAGGLESLRGALIAEEQLAKSPEIAPIELETMSRRPAGRAHR